MCCAYALYDPNEYKKDNFGKGFYMVCSVFVSVMLAQVAFNSTFEYQNWLRNKKWTTYRQWGIAGTGVR